MRNTDIEGLKEALARSAWLIGLFVLVGLVGMNVVKQLSGDEYASSARVVLNTTDLAAAVANVDVPYVDPERKDEAELNLASSPGFYAFVARQTGRRLGTGLELDEATSVAASNNVVEFTAKADRAARARAIANAVATAYPTWRARVSGRAIDTAIANLEAQARRQGRNASLDQQLQELQVLKTLTAGSTLFVEGASNPEKLSPRPLRDSLIGVAIGLVIGLLVVGIRELLDTTVRSDQEVEEALGVPVLATIESLPRHMRTAIVAHGNGRAADEYELLAASVAQLYGNGDHPVQIAITSAMPGEGKTTTAANLAVALARRGSKVVLADFDLRKPSVSKYFAIPREASGVSELLAGTVDVSAALWRVQLNGDGAAADGVAKRPRQRAARPELAGVGSLSVMPGGGSGAGQGLSRFAELPALLTKLPSAVDFVLIDTPPALHVSVMTEVAQSVDAVVVVVRQGVVTRRRLRALGRQTRLWRTKLAVVLNDVPTGEPYGYRYGDASTDAA